MGRLVGVDFGTTKVGLSIADPLHLFAQSVGTYSPVESIEILKDMLAKEGIDALIVGWPPPLEEEEKIHRSIRGWIQRVQKQLGQIEIVMIDESFSSREAEETLFKSGIKKKQRRQKGRVDQVAAAIILQRYLDGLSE